MKIKSIRGFNDILPDKTSKFQFVENLIIKKLQNSGFNEIRTPLVEYQELFKRVGEQTDIVTKEMYNINRTDEVLTLRPEGTVGVARAILEGQLINTIQKLWYNGYMFRAENPQKGRYRQFQQIGVEVYGISDISIETELLNTTFNIFNDLGIIDSINLEINTIGNFEDRQKYSKALIEYMKPFYINFNEEFISKFEKNPFRLLDTKDKNIQNLLANSPKIEDYINEESKKSFNKLKSNLDLLDIKYKVNNKLVRGLDYYNDVVFEWTSNLSESQSTICAGGRYDGLLSQISDFNVPAFGFAIGVDRLVLLLEELNIFKDKERDGACICVLNSENYIYGLKLRDILSESLNIKVSIINQQTSLKSQIKKIDKLNIKYAFILGDYEIKNNGITIKNMNTGQQTFSLLKDMTNNIKTA